MGAVASTPKKTPKSKGLLSRFFGKIKKDQDDDQDLDQMEREMLDNSGYKRKSTLA